MIRATTKTTEIFCLVFQYIGADPWTFCALLGNGRGAGEERKIATATSMVILTPITMFRTMKKKTPKLMSLICFLISTRRTSRFRYPVESCSRYGFIRCCGSYKTESCLSTRKRVRRRGDNMPLCNHGTFSSNFFVELQYYNTESFLIFGNFETEENKHYREKLQKLLNCVKMSCSPLARDYCFISP